MNNDNINNKANQNLSPSEENRYGAAECGDCNTCGKCDEQLQEEETALFDAADEVGNHVAAPSCSAINRALENPLYASSKYFHTQGEQFL